MGGTSRSNRVSLPLPHYCYPRLTKYAGISTLGDHPSGVPEYLRPLLDFAMTVIPEPQRASTPIYLLATAGMRLLPPDQQQAVLSATCDYIRQSYPFELPDCSTNIRIISGEEEGLYGWIAVNYLMDGFDRHQLAVGDEKHKGSSTYGFLDMGGASTQIAFEPSAKEQVAHADNLTEIKLRLLSGKDVTHPVFVTTWLGFGTNQARERYIDQAVQDYIKLADPTQIPGNGKGLGAERPIELIDDPCLPRDLLLSSGDKHAGYTLKGTGDFRECVRRTGPLLNKEVECLDNPCLFNGVHVPPIDFSVNHFIGISEYWYSTQDVWSSNGGVYDFVEFEKNAIEYCSRDWSDILTDHQSGDKWRPSVEVSRLETQCFKAAWIVNILHEGIGIPRIIDRGGEGDGKNVTDKAIQKGVDKGLVQAQPSFQSLNEVGDVAISWTLGKMVLEVSKGTTAIGSDDVHPDKLSDSRGRWRGHIPSWKGDFRSSLASVKNADPVPLVSLVVLSMIVWLFCLSSGATRRRQSVFGGIFAGKRKHDFLPLSQDEGASSGSESSGGGSRSPRGRKKAKTLSSRILSPLRLGAMRFTSTLRSFARSRRSAGPSLLPMSQSSVSLGEMDSSRPRTLHTSRSAPFLRAVAIPHSTPNTSAGHWNDAPDVSERERLSGAPSLLPRSHSANYLPQSAPATRTVSPPPMNVIPPSPHPTSRPSSRSNSRPTTPSSRSGGLTKLTPRARESSSEDGGSASTMTSPIKPFSLSSLQGNTPFNSSSGTSTPTAAIGAGGPLAPTAVSTSSSSSLYPLSTAVWESLSSQGIEGASPTSLMPTNGGLERAGAALRASSRSQNGSRSDLVALARRSTGNLHGSTNAGET